MILTKDKFKIPGSRKKSCGLRQSILMTLSWFHDCKLCLILQSRIKQLYLTKSKNIYNLHLSLIITDYH